jgi:signal transduction histidine kinase
MGFAMSCRQDVIGTVGLQFFGEITASMSHEIRNALAIIDQNAGLLKDFTVMAEEGMPIDPERFKARAEKIMKQVRRADGIVRTIRRLAHSIDESAKTVDLGEIVEFVVEVSGRSAAAHGVSLEPKPPENPVRITTTPFLLESLVWLCLDVAMDAAGDQKTVGLIIEETENGARVRFTRLEGLAKASTDTFRSEREEALLGALKAELAADIGAGEIVLALPGDIHGPETPVR